ncbi:NUDIX domain-containing protein [Spirosoma sp. HMF4905]|uniref:NUDIX domain-containing protein n=2 Tax=Spirosoma arboris TaxID=2682092 RepID=A0A7K1S8R9_9BACT|nr:NUDIX domain-containing protein [Spirosoma arboris]
MDLSDRSENQSGLDSASPVDSTREEVQKLYGNRLRLRVCGLYREGDRLLMVRHRGIGLTDTFWCPPGGGPQFSETAPKALIREFMEETGLEVEIGDMLFVNEFIQPPLHAMELFFAVRATGGSLRLGIDPEMSLNGQIIEEVRLMSFEEIKSYPPKEVHALFQYCDSLDDVFRLRGYLQ